MAALSSRSLTRALNTEAAAGDTYDSIENVAGGTGDDMITGNSGANTLYGVLGNDTLDGGGGADRMEGGIGNDIYINDNAGDVIIEVATSGVDMIKTSLASISLGPHIEYLSGSVATGQTLAGNNLNNNIWGNNGVDFLAGGVGNDQLFGGGNGDTLNGGTGDDKLSGGLGNDTLTGSGNSDTFIFNTLLNASTNVDHIADFSNATGDDIFNLDDAIFTAIMPGALDSQFFVANATGTPTDGNDRIMYETDTGRVLYDPDGTGATASIVFAILDHKVILTAADFFVI